MSRPPPADFYRPNAYQANDSVGYLMRRVVTNVSQDIGRRLEPHGLTHAQWAPLFKLHNCQVSTVAELARTLEMDPGAMTRLLDRLEAKGLCKRLRSEVDRRVVNLELTPDGEAVARKIPAALCDSMNAHLAGFSEAEWQQLKGYLQRILANSELLREDG